MRNEGYDDGIDHPSCNHLSSHSARLILCSRILLVFSGVQSVIQGLCFGYGCVIELAHSDLGHRTRISTRPSFFVRASLVEGDSTIYTGIGLGGWPRLFRYQEGVDDMGPTTSLPADGGNIYCTICSRLGVCRWCRMVYRW